MIKVENIKEKILNLTLLPSFKKIVNIQKRQKCKYLFSKRIKEKLK
jgi:hypothetical protein